MEYKNTVNGVFLARPNRFIAHVEVDGRAEVCHVKNTGRCRELLRPGVPVVLCRAENSQRKTGYDLIAVYKDGQHLINMDSQAPNAAAAELLSRLYPGIPIRPEQRWGSSRFDFALDFPEGRAYLEVKGCTLERNGHAFFPDAPTQRGTRHIQELIALRKSGGRAMLLFLIQMKGVHAFSPNEATDPAFAEALRQARQAGVEILCYDCVVQENSMMADAPVPICY